MLTQCPSCQTTFRVTSEILRVADGQVRCGRCQNQFDALERLIEETDSGEIESGRYLRPPPRPARPAPAEQIQVEEQATHEDITLEGRHIEISGTYRIPDTLRGGAQLKEETTEEWFEIEEIDADAASQPPLEARAAETAAVEQRLHSTTSDAVDREAERATPAATPPARATRAQRLRQASAPASSAVELLQRPRRTYSLVWKLCAGPLALVLLLQILHNHRATLALHPQLGPPLVSIYRTFGMPLRPDWNLHAYQIQQWHLISDPSAPGTLKGRASIKNAASFPQPYPLLRLVLQDRWGGQVRARDFTPREYLAAAPARLLAPAEAANVTIAIVDPGPDAEGFEVDLCLEGERGTVCAGDVPEKSADAARP